MLSHDSIEFHFFFIQGCLKESSWRQIPKKQENHKLKRWVASMVFKELVCFAKILWWKTPKRLLFLLNKRITWKHKFQHHFLTQQNINSMENLGIFRGHLNYLPPHGSLMFASSNHVVDFWEFHTRRPLQITDVSQRCERDPTDQIRGVHVFGTSLKTKMAGWKIPFFFNRKYIDSFMVGFPLCHVGFPGGTGCWMTGPMGRAVFFPTWKPL